MHPWIAEQLGLGHRRLLLEQAERIRLARSVQGRRKVLPGRGFSAAPAFCPPRRTLLTWLVRTWQAGAARGAAGGRANSSKA